MITIVEVWQAIVPDDTIDLFLSLPLLFWPQEHDEEEPMYLSGSLYGTGRVSGMKYGSKTVRTVSAPPPYAVAALVLIAKS